MKKFNEVYRKIIMEMNNRSELFNLTLLYIVNEENVQHNPETGFIDDNQIKAAGDKFFAAFGGQRTEAETYDVSYYIGSHENEGVYAWPYEFKGISKEQIVELMNSETPFNEGMPLLELIEQCNLDEGDLYGDIDIYDDPDAIIEYLRQHTGRNSLIQKFKKI